MGITSIKLVDLQLKTVRMQKSPVKRRTLRQASSEADASAAATANVHSPSADVRTEKQLAKRNVLHHKHSVYRFSSFHISLLSSLLLLFFFFLAEPTISVTVDGLV